MNKISKLAKTGDKPRKRPRLKRLTKRPADGGYARGHETRQRIVETALKVFGESGFAQASTRAIARSAGVNLGALTYYFGNKEGLYQACAEHISESAEQQTKPGWDLIEAALQNDALSRGDLLALLRTLVEGSIADLAHRENPESWLLFVAREYAQPTIAGEIIYKRVTSKSIAILAALIGRIIEQPADHPETILRAIAVIGQFIMFRRMRRMTLRALNWTSFDKGGTEMIRSVLWQQTEAMVTRPKRKT